MKAYARLAAALIALELLAACAPEVMSAITPTSVPARASTPEASREPRLEETHAAQTGAAESVPTITLVSTSVPEARIPATPAANAPAPSATSIPSAPIAAMPGEYGNSIVVNGQPRDYVLHIPPRYDGVHPVPLVFVLHGHGTSDKEVEQNSGMSAKADRENFIVAYPNGTGNPRAWNAIFFPVPPPPVDDVAFVQSLIDLLTSSLRVDSKRVYVSGFSNGAMLTYLLGAKLSVRLAAIAIVEGTIGAKQPDGSLVMIPKPSQPLPVVAFHGKQDDVVPYDGGARTEHVQFLSVSESIGFWVQQDGCKNTPKANPIGNGNVVETDYALCAAGSEVVLYSIGTGKHDWPSAAMPNQISATDAIWEFFARHPKQ
jgi:polyhydroxybutyrate depolymerase